MNTGDSVIVLLEKLDSASFPDSKMYTLNDVVRTHYDFESPMVEKEFKQENLRTHVSYVEVMDGDLNNAVATYYSYDIHGNVKSILQQVPGIKRKRTDYVYDLVSGKLNFVMYQYGKKDEFMHRYTYDSEGRLRQAYTSNDGFIWDKDADYIYYQHGLLARAELGEYRVQGLDNVYTLQGWTKGLNGFVDPGSDGGNSLVPKDQLSFNLGYYNGDYAGINLGVSSKYYQMPVEQYQNLMGNQGLYNGHVAWMNTDIKKIGSVEGNRNKSMQGMLYRYDQLGRLLRSRSLTQFNGSSGFGSRTDTPAAYDEDYSYDANGNLLVLQRRDGKGAMRDDFNYSYYRETNMLRQVISVTRDTTYADVVVTSDNKVYQNIKIIGQSYVQSGTDVTIKAIDNIEIGNTLSVQDNARFHAYVISDDEGMYLYDADGNLIWNQEEGVKMSWNGRGKIRQITKGDTTAVSFRYDGSGNRVEKRVVRRDTTYVTRYIHDASGDVMAIYSDSLLVEQSIYGFDRLGIYRSGRRPGHRTMGTKRYELKNHLGNVLAVLTDNIHFNSDSAWANVVSVNDYYPFGLSMEGRSYNDSTYRYGFHGKEKDSRSEFGDTHYDYGFRIYNPRIARFLSVDPLAKEYPWYTPYQFAGNSPIIFVDKDGMEPQMTWQSIKIYRVGNQVTKEVEVHNRTKAEYQAAMKNYRELTWKYAIGHKDGKHFFYRDFAFWAIPKRQGVTQVNERTRRDVMKEFHEMEAAAKQILEQYDQEYFNGQLAELKYNKMVADAATDVKRYQDHMKYENDIKETRIEGLRWQFMVSLDWLRPHLKKWVVSELPALLLDFKWLILLIILPEEWCAYLTLHLILIMICNP